MRAASGLPRLSSDERGDLLRQARAGLEARLRGRRWAPHARTAAMTAPAATFVTLRRPGGERRCCCGETTPRRSLVESVCEMAVASALSDPRFPPVVPAEVVALRIEITVLSAMQPIDAREVEVGRHGLLVTRDDRRGLLLPQVAPEQGWDRDELLAAVCRKAELPETAWREPATRLLGFEAVSWGEELPPSAGAGERRYT